MISVIWIFFLGFSLGQNEAPETAVPFLATMLPKQELVYNKELPVTENELTYSTILQKPNTPIVVPNDANVIEKDKTPTALQTPLESTQNIVQNVKTQGEQLYKFSLQLLAVKQKKSAEEYRDKLRQQGIATELVEASMNDISWYRVYTTFTGTVIQLNGFKDKLASFGIVDTILRERIPQ